MLYVSGAIGDAALGLRARRGLLPSLAAEHRDFLVDRYLLPRPRLALGRALARFANGGMDVSDGLVGDLPKLASASRVSARVEGDRLPLSRAMRDIASPQQARDWALAAGDDYELLLAVPQERFGQLAEAAAQLGLALTTIGEVGPGSGVTWALNGRSFEPGASGYDHFR